MASDVMVAPGQVTVDGSTFFACNSHRFYRECQVLRRIEGRAYAPGEKVQAQGLELPQTRQTFTVLGSQPEGYWGFTHGVNEHGVAVGRTTLRGKLQSPAPALLGTDLVRLVLERSRTGNQAVDLLTDLIERHGQGLFPGCPAQAEGDNAFLIATATEAFALEAAGKHWVCQHVEQPRAISDVSTIHQDWGRVSRGLSTHAIAECWWPADGSKLDFAEAVSGDPVGQLSALRRWGRATLMLEEQSGHIDSHFVRRLLGDHYEGMHQEASPFASAGGPAPLCQHGGPVARYTASSWIIALRPKSDRPRPVWCAFGPPCTSVYFPIFLEGEPPEAFTTGGQQPTSEGIGWRGHRLNEQLRRDPSRIAEVSEVFDRLQTRFEREAEEFAAEAELLPQEGSSDPPRLATLFMQHCLERYSEALDGLLRHDSQLSPVAAAVGVGK